VEEISSGEKETQEQEKGQQEEAPREPRRLYRSRTNRVIGGVAGGIGEYLGIDPIIIRIIWVILALFAGAGVVAYILAWIIIPERPAGEGAPQAPEGFSSEAGLIVGLILVGLGAWFLLTNLNLIPPPLFAALRTIRLALWPITLILVGIIIIIVASRGRGVTVSTKGKVLHRSRTNRRIAGVAGGLGGYLGIDPTLIRLGWVAFTILSPAAGIIAYIVAAIVIPEEPKA
jgi:phage shock protein PspC (stress-responsive transcriptional regulator)